MVQHVASGHQPVALRGFSCLRLQHAEAFQVQQLADTLRPLAGAAHCQVAPPVRWHPVVSGWNKFDLGMT